MKHTVPVEARPMAKGMYVLSVNDHMYVRSSQLGYNDDDGNNNNNIVSIYAN
jgi:hypothetical protein